MSLISTPFPSEECDVCGMSLGNDSYVRFDFHGTNKTVLLHPQCSLMVGRSLTGNAIRYQKQKEQEKQRERETSNRVVVP